MIASPSPGGYLREIFSDSVPDLRAGNCVNHQGGLPPEVWDSDAANADRALAVAACRSCPVLVPCGIWALHQPRWSLSGIVAGHNYGSGYRYRPGAGEATLCP